MLTQYLQAAMNQARYEILGDGSFAGKIPDCAGVIAFGHTLEACREELLEALEGWVLVGLKHQQFLPIIGGYDLNKVEVNGKTLATV